MRKKKVGAIAIQSFALLVVLGTAYLITACQAMAQEAVTPYPNMAPTTNTSDGLMFYYSQTDPATWGANLPGSPIPCF